MLFAEMLGEERKEGKREGKMLGEKRILELLEKMEEAGGGGGRAAAGVRGGVHELALH